MTLGQKASLSLLIAVLVFAGFSVAAFSGLFDIIESRFYDPAVSRAYEKSLAAAAKASDVYHGLNIDRFSAVLKRDSLRRSFLPNISAKDAFERSNALGRLVEETPGLTGLRLLDSNGKRIHFSTFPGDVIKRTNVETLFRNYGEAGDPPYAAFAAEADSKGIIRIDPTAGRFVYSLPFFDSYDVYRGTAVFFVSQGGLVSQLLKAGLLSVGDEAFAAGDRGVILKAPSVGREFLSARAAELWASELGEKPLTIAVGDSGESFILFSQVTQSIGRIGIVVPASAFSVPTAMKWLLLATFFATAYLLAFLLLNLRQDRMAVLADRIKRFQIVLLEESLDRKTDMDFQRWNRELEARRTDVRREIKKSVGRIRKSREGEVDELIDKSWDEILTVLGRRAGVDPLAPSPNAIGVKEIERLLSEALKSGTIVIPAGTVVQSAAKAQPAELSPRAASKSAPVAKNAPALKSASSKSAATKETPPKALPVAPVLMRAPASEATEAVEKIEEAEAVEELEEAEAVEELEEVEAAEELEEVEAAEEAEELEEAEAAEELEEVEAAEEAEELEEAEAVEELEEAEAVEEAEELEEAEAVEEAGAVEEVEAVEEAEAVEELEEAAAVEELEEVEAAEEAEELEETEAVEEAEELEEAGAVEEVEEAEDLEEAEAVEEVEPVEEAEAVEELEEAEAVEKAEAVEDLEEAEAVEELEEVEAFESIEILEGAEEIEELEAWEEGEEEVAFGDLRVAAARALELATSQEEDIPLIPESNGLELVDEADLTDYIGFIEMDDMGKGRLGDNGREEATELEEVPLEGDQYDEPKLILDFAPTAHHDAEAPPPSEEEDDTIELDLGALDLSRLEADNDAAEEDKKGSMRRINFDAGDVFEISLLMAPAKIDSEIYKLALDREPDLSFMAVPLAAQETMPEPAREPAQAEASSDASMTIEDLLGVESDENDSAELEELVDSGWSWIRKSSARLMESPLAGELPSYDAPSEGSQEDEADVSESDEESQEPAGEGPIVFLDGIFQVDRAFARSEQPVDPALRNLVDAVLDKETIRQP